MKTLDELPPFLKERRQQLKLSQQDMRMGIGMSQQQYQKIETGADPRLSTLLRILEGMDLEMMFVPRKRVQEIKEVLAAKSGTYLRESDLDTESVNDDWDEILGDLRE